MPSTQKLAVILFADIAGYTAMMQEDQEGALSLLKRLDKHLPPFDGRGWKIPLLEVD